MSEEFSFIIPMRYDYSFVVTANSVIHIRHWNTAGFAQGSIPIGILCGITLPDPLFANSNLVKVDTRLMCGVCVVKAVLAELGHVNDDT